MRKKLIVLKYSSKEYENLRKKNYSENLEQKEKKHNCSEIFKF